jgi:hypothetical protein
MKKHVYILTLIGVMFFSTGCAKTPEAPKNVNDNNSTTIAKNIDNNITANRDENKVVTNSSDEKKAVTLTSDENKVVTNSSDENKVVTNSSDENKVSPIDTLVSKITKNQLIPKEQRKVYTSFDAVNNTYPISINGVNVQSYDRSLKYDNINGKKLTACTRTKDVTMTSKNETKKFRVCKTTNYDWIVK